jgi:hypothetical protein
LNQINEHKQKQQNEQEPSKPIKNHNEQVNEQIPADKITLMNKNFEKEVIELKTIYSIEVNAPTHCEWTWKFLYGLGGELPVSIKAEDKKLCHFFYLLYQRYDLLVKQHISKIPETNKKTNRDENKLSRKSNSVHILRSTEPRKKKLANKSKSGAKIPQKAAVEQKIKQAKKSFEELNLKLKQIEIEIIESSRDLKISEIKMNRCTVIERLSEVYLFKTRSTIHYVLIS